MKLSSTVFTNTVLCTIYLYHVQIKIICAHVAKLPLPFLALGQFGAWGNLSAPPQSFKHSAMMSGSPWAADFLWFWSTLSMLCAVGKCVMNMLPATPTDSPSRGACVHQICAAHKHVLPSFTSLICAGCAKGTTSEARCLREAARMFFLVPALRGEMGVCRVTGGGFLVFLLFFC